MVLKLKCAEMLYRCVGKYVYDNKLTQSTKIKIETLAGIKILDMTVEDGKVYLVRVDMGEPILKPKIFLLSVKRIYLFLNLYTIEW